MKRRSLFAGLAGAVLCAALAAGVAPSHAQGAANASGEVTKIDKASGRVEVRHDGIKALDMPPMRMFFRAREPRLLDGLAVGDKVRFTAAKVDGQFTVTAISKAP